MDQTPLEIVARLLELPEAERDAALAHACGDNQALRRDIVELLAIDAAATGFLEPMKIAQVDVDHQQPEAVGRYHIIDTIGEGGFGMVYLAEQTEPIKRRVALKIMKPGMDSLNLLRRFEQERHMLAMLDHPNIARVLDGGIVSEGQPSAGRSYFAMEFVDGVPMTTYVRDNGLDVESRIALILQACAAAQHAHMKGVIHRDLKPSNMLVTEVDGQPVCKIIDFGIAKVVEGSGEPAMTQFTQAGAMVGTPQYMSPEQARGSVAVDTRSDVYALGVVLYEVLAGVPPFDMSALRSTDRDRLRKLITEIEPAAPSSRIGRAEASTELAEPRVLATLRKRVRGDLDWITLRAMAKEPDRRYATVAALSEDLRRYLRSAPVEAGPPNVSYRMQKFVSRNRVMVGVGALAAVLLGGGLAGTAFGFVQARVSAAQALQSEQIATREAAAAEAIVAFLTEDLLAAANPARAARADVTMREVLLEASNNIEGRFEAEPDVNVRVRSVLADTMEQVGMVAEAEPHRRRAVAAQAGIDGPSSIASIDLQQALATNLMNQGEFDDAIELTRRIIEALKTLGESRDDQRQRALSNLGAAYLQIGQFKDATPILEQTLAAKRESLGDLDSSTLSSIHNLAGLYGEMGELERAEALAREAYVGRQEVEGAGATRTFSSLNVLAWVLTKQGRLDEAADELQGALRVARERLGPGHSMTMSLTRTLAFQYQNRGEFEKAELVVRPTYEAVRATSGIESPDTQTTMYELGAALNGQGKHAEAIVLLEELVAATRPTLAAGDPRLADYLWALGEALAGVDRFEDAEQALLESNRIIEAGDETVRLRQPRTVEALADLYTQWHEADPKAGKDADSARWRAVLDASETP